MRNCTSRSWVRVFQSTPSTGRATFAKNFRSIAYFLFQSTPSTGRATRLMCERLRALRFQSTPSTGRATQGLSLSPYGTLFQSTPSTGRATIFVWNVSSKVCNFNPRPPRGGRPVNALRTTFVVFISIHALHGEGDGEELATKEVSLTFQSTPSTGRATAKLHYASCGYTINIAQFA